MTLEGRRAMGLEPFVLLPDSRNAVAKVVKEANSLLFKDY